MDALAGFGGVGAVEEVFGVFGVGDGLDLGDEGGEGGLFEDGALDLGLGVDESAALEFVGFGVFGLEGGGALRDDLLVLREEL